MVNKLARSLQTPIRVRPKGAKNMTEALQISAPKHDRKRLAAAAFTLSAAALGVAAMLAAAPAHAQTRAGYANEFSRPYGINPGDESRPYDARTRDLNGNRVIIDGRIVTGDDLSSLPLGLYNGANTGMGFSGTGSAIGNQLNVNTSGSFNTVVVNSTQINNGNQTVNINAGVNCNGPAATCPSRSSSNATSSSTLSSSPAQQVLNGGLDF
jgi:holdfast attachment protein HfaA